MQMDFTIRFKKQIIGSGFILFLRVCQNLCYMLIYTKSFLLFKIRGTKYSVYSEAVTFRGVINWPVLLWLLPLSFVKWSNGTIVLQLRENCAKRHVLSCDNLSCSSCWHQRRRFYLTWDMTNLYQFIEASLEWHFSELLFSDASLWNQHKYTAFKIFTCRVLIIFMEKANHYSTVK